VAGSAGVVRGTDRVVATREARFACVGRVRIGNAGVDQLGRAVRDETELDAGGFRGGVEAVVGEERSAVGERGERRLVRADGAVLCDERERSLRGIGGPERCRDQVTGHLPADEKARSVVRQHDPTRIEPERRDVHRRRVHHAVGLDAADLDAVIVGKGDERRSLEDRRDL